MRRPYLLVGDIGGTHSVFELFENRGDGARLVHEHSYRSGAFPDFGALLGDFLAQAPVRPAAGSIGAACFSVACKLGDGSFVHAFTDKERFSDLLRRHPLHIVTDSKFGLKRALRLIRRAL